MFAPRRILVPVDFTNSAMPAVVCAHDLARAFGSRVHLLHVTPDPGAQGWATMVPHQQFDSRAAEWRQDAMDELAGFAAGAGGYGGTVDGGPRATLAVRSSADPASAILAYAQEEGCDLIVMGTHRPSALAALFRGSTAERVRRRAGCPVTLVPPTAPVPARRRWMPADVEGNVAIAS